MNPDLEALRITERELERLSGVEVGEIFVGGVLGGVYRPSIFQQHQRSLLFYLTELLVGVVVFVFSLPIGLFATRNASTTANHLSTTLPFFAITLSMTFLIMVGWNGYMVSAAKRLKPLMHLLDEVDRYHEVIQAVAVLDRLAAIDATQVNLINRDEVLVALQITRENLIAGLKTEKILRENRKLMARRSALLSQIEHNLTRLKTLEVHEQANEYSQLLNEALHIGMSVQQEMEKLSRF